MSRGAYNPDPDGRRQGYVPAEPSRSPRYVGHDDYHGHPLHHVYRRRIRGVRVRWLGGGFFLGALAGAVLTLLLSALVVTQVPAVRETIAGDPDISVVIGESYLNRVAGDRVKAGFNTGVPGLTLTGFTMDLNPGNRMDLRADFGIEAFFLAFNTTAAVKNEVSVKDGKLVINTVGDPQLGNLNIPLDALPFNLNDTIRSAIDKLNNDVLISEINKSLQSGFGGSDFIVNGVTTSDTGLVVRLSQQK